MNRMRHWRRNGLRLTADDAWAWCHLLNRIGAACAINLRMASAEQDESDAELVFALQMARRDCDRAGVSHCLLAGRETALQGWDDERQSLVELGLAMRIPKLTERYRK